MIFIKTSPHIYSTHASKTVIVKFISNTYLCIALELENTGTQNDAFNPC